MDTHIQKALHDKLYEKRKTGALELEKLIRDTLTAGNHERIQKIVDQLCHDYAYALHQPYARNGGLIGLAAASIALGSQEVAPYLEEIIPPVLACFGDQDARVRYYACESMYNIAKTSKGEILPYFNEVFDALSKLSADSEISVKNGAELLDRLVKDIVSESAASYVSVVHPSGRSMEEREAVEAKDGRGQQHTAFSLSRFIPLLQERIQVINPFSRMFLVQWIILLDSIPDLELVSYVPSFLSGLFRFLDDSNQDVVTSTQHMLERFLDDIKLIARVKRERAANHKLSLQPSLENFENGRLSPVKLPPSQISDQEQIDNQTNQADDQTAQQEQDDSGTDSLIDIDRSSESHDDWVPGQDVYTDYPRILEILVAHLRDKSEHVQLTVLRWIDSFFEICPEDVLPLVPRLLDSVLPALSSDIDQVRKAATRVNSSLVEYITSIEDEEERFSAGRDHTPHTGSPEKRPQAIESAGRTQPSPGTLDTASEQEVKPAPKLDYEATVNALTTQFLNENEATRAASLSWLIMLQQRAPKRVLDAHDSHFPALLKTLADTSDTVVTRDLQLLCQISKNSDDSYFSFFMINLLKLFSGDRRLLETRGNLIIRQLCLNLGSERIYRIMADCLEKEEDIEFASIMVQNLNNNLLTAPELGELRKKLRSWEQRVCTNTRQTKDTSNRKQDGQTLFVALFKAWCTNAIASISLCLLAQAYEQAYSLLQIFADVEMTVNMLIQIDKLVQLLESPVFTYLRLQLLEPDRFPFLYKTLYGILMLLPQSAAFAALKNRLNSVSAIGYAHIPPSRGGPGSSTPTSTSTQGTPLPGRLKSRDDGVRWGDLLERFRGAQERRRRPAPRPDGSEGDRDGLAAVGLGSAEASRSTSKAPSKAGAEKRASLSFPVQPSDAAKAPVNAAMAREKDKESRASRFSASHLGKVVSGVKRKEAKKP